MLKDAPDFKLSVSNASMHKRWGQIKYDLMSAAARQAAFHYQAGGVWWHCSNFQKVMSNPTAKNEEGKKTKPIFLGGLLYITISHRIHGAAIYGNIYHQDTPNVSIYTIHGSYGIFIIYPPSIYPFQGSAQLCHGRTPIPVKDCVFAHLLWIHMQCRVYVVSSSFSAVISLWHPHSPFKEVLN